MEIKRTEISTFLVYFIFSTAIGASISSTGGKEFLVLLPTLIGILLGGVLASLAIIFGLLTSQDLKMISTLRTENSNDPYMKFLGSTKLDAKIIFFSLCVSIFILLIKDTGVPFIELPLKYLYISGIFVLLISISSVYDIIMSLYGLNELRYKISAVNNKIKK